MTVFISIEGLKVYVITDLARPEEDFGHSKAVVVSPHPHGLEEGLAEQPRVQAGQLLRKVRLVPGSR